MLTGGSRKLKADFNIKITVFDSVREKTLAIIQELKNIGISGQKDFLYCVLIYLNQMVLHCKEHLSV